MVTESGRNGDQVLRRALGQPSRESSATRKAFALEVDLKIVLGEPLATVSTNDHDIRDTSSPPHAIRVRQRFAGGPQLGCPMSDDPTVHVVRESRRGRPRPRRIRKDVQVGERE